MDAIGADFLMSCNTIIDRLGAKSCPIQLPIGAESTFKGIVDIIERKAEIYTNDLGTNIEVTDVPEDLQDLTEEYRMKLLEYLADYDEDLMMQVLEGEEPSIEEIKRVLRIAVCNGDFFPVLCGSAYKNKGVQMVLDAVVDYLPSPWTFLPSTVPRWMAKPNSVMPLTTNLSPLWRSKSPPTPSWANCPSSVYIPERRQPAAMF